MTDIPEGMTAVSQEQFFALLKADTRDIIPSVRNETFTTWETKSRDVWGWSAPGWKNPGEHPPLYAVRNPVDVEALTKAKPVF